MDKRIRKGCQSLLISFFVLWLMCGPPVLAIMVVLDTYLDLSIDWKSVVAVTAALNMGVVVWAFAEIILEREMDRE